VFSNAIEQAFADGFNGFRAAANMSWALDLPDGPERLITYEALLRQRQSRRALRRSDPHLPAGLVGSSSAMLRTLDLARREGRLDDPHRGRERSGKGATGAFHPRRIG
jgi:hypothetical protein